MINYHAVFLSTSYFSEYGWDYFNATACFLSLFFVFPVFCITIFCSAYKVCATSPGIRDTEHLFLELPLLEAKLRQYIMSVKGSWSENAVRETDAWLDKGLRHRCITRRV